MERIGCDGTEWIDGKKEVKVVLKDMVWWDARSDWRE